MTALRTAQLEKSTLSHRFFVQASVPSRLANVSPPPGTNEQMYRPV